MQNAVVAAFCLSGLLPIGTIQADEAVLEAGKYKLTLKVEGAPEGQREKSQDAQVSKVGKTLIVDTVDGIGKPLRLEGIAAPGSVKFGVTRAEDKRGLVTILFISRAVSSREASGKMVIFSDGQKVATGSWNLAPPEAPKDE